jgi:type I restriction enzyme R subunit
MYYNPWQEIEASQRNLPHWHQDTRLYFVTFRLADSVPTEKLKQWREHKRLWQLAHPEPLSPEDVQEFEAEFPNKLNEWLDTGMGQCLLKKTGSIRIVADALRFFDGQRYQLGDWVIMPNHLHLLLKPSADEPLPRILHSLKSFTAQKINQNESRKGKLWQDESYTRIVRSPEEHSHYKCYIEQNPQKAGTLIPESARHRSTSL